MVSQAGQHMGQKVKGSPRELFKMGIILLYTEVAFRRKVPRFGVLETWDQILTQTMLTGASVLFPVEWHEW